MTLLNPCKLVEIRPVNRAQGGWKKITFPQISNGGLMVIYHGGK